MSSKENVYDYDYAVDYDTIDKSDTLTMHK